MVPNLFIVGAPRTGTTSLYNYLSNHPDVFMSTPKEINYFSKNELDKRDLYYRNLKLNSITEYEHLFKQATKKKVIGEASVSYLFYPKIPKKIFRYNPKSKIIILLRNPIDRSISHYLMNLRLGFVKVPFDNIITKSTEIRNINIMNPRVKF